MVFSTERGLEEFLVHSLSGRGSPLPHPFGFRGRVLLRGVSPRQLAQILYTNPFYHKAYILLFTGGLSATREDLDSCYLAVKNSAIPELLNQETTFGVRCIRRGEHPYSSQEMASYAGSAVIDGCRIRRGFRPKVNLDDPDLLVVVDITDKRVALGVELVGLESMHRRGWRVYNHPAAIKSTLASAMVCLSGYEDGKVLWDPMCGGGTIPIEAAHRCIGLPPAFFRRDTFLFLRTPLVDRGVWEEVVAEVDSRIDWRKSCHIYASDRSPKHLKGAVLNAESALVERKISFYVSDVESFPHTGSVDCIACNPPYGIRMGNPKDAERSLRALFKTFCNSSADSMALVHPEREKVKSLVSAFGLRLDKAIDAYNGNVKVFLFLVKKA